MRRLVAALLAALVVISSVAVAPAQVLGASPAKVVVIVGPAGWITGNYRSEAEAMAQAARRYTTDVTTFYSPNATWDVVKPALQGATVVVYMGHGNGFPSPYSATLNPLQQDGLGLNPYAGSGDYTTSYVGEATLAAEVRLAPNAVVLLHHLCYASGNSEPGRGEPTIDVAQQRIDNMAAGWAAAGARAVIADAHYGAPYYMDALFSTHQTLDALWRGAPIVNGNYQSFPSVRTPGLLGQLDPSTPTTGFYRSFLGDPSLTTDAVLAATGAPADPGLDPALAAPAAPADLVPPTLLPVGSALAKASISPNGDGVGDSVSFAVTLVERAMLEATVTPALGGAPVRSWATPAGIGRATLRWDGRGDGGAPLPDGTYLVSVVARDAAGNASQPLVKRVVVAAAVGWLATSVPAIWPADPAAASPAGAQLTFSLAGPAFVSVRVVNAANRTVATLLPRTQLPSGPASVAWDGRDGAGALAPVGTYRLVVAGSANGVSLSQSVPLGVGLFALRANVTAAVRGGGITLTAVAGKPLAAAPVVLVTQPGVANRSLQLTPAGDRWTVRIPVLRGRAGQIRLTVIGTDLAGATAASDLVLPLR